jgi:hypothetical protein
MECVRSPGDSHTRRQNCRMKAKPDKLKEAVDAIAPETLSGSLAKSEFIQFRVSEADKKSIKTTAEGLDLTVSEYLLKLHTLVAEKLNRR